MIDAIFQLDDRAFGEITQWIRRVARPTQNEQGQVDRIIRRAFAKTFSGQGGDVGWQPLAEVTAAQRRRLGFPGRRPILIRTGDYMQSFTQTGGDHVFEVDSDGSGVTFRGGSEEERVQWLEYGTSRMPARPVTDISDRTNEEVLDQYDDIVAKLFDRIAAR